MDNIALLLQFKSAHNCWFITSTRH